MVAPNTQSLENEQKRREKKREFIVLIDATPYELFLSIFVSPAFFRKPEKNNYYKHCRGSYLLFNWAPQTTMSATVLSY